MEIQDILRLKFPDADFKKDVIIQDDGNGAYIKRWNLLAPQPTQENLNDWEEEVSTLYQQEQFNAVNKEVLLQLEEIDKKSIRALRVNDSPRLEELEAQAVLLRQQLIKDF